MKFGRGYHGLQIPQWAPSYFNYNAYKRLVKTALRQGSEVEAKVQSTGQPALGQRHLLKMLSCNRDPCFLESRD